jgi:hypothetical protein
MNSELLTPTVLAGVAGFIAFQLHELVKPFFNRLANEGQRSAANRLLSFLFALGSGLCVGWLADKAGLLNNEVTMWTIIALMSWPADWLSYRANGVLKRIIK